MRLLIVLALALTTPLIAQPENIEATKIEAFGNVSQLELAVSDNGLGAVLLVMASEEPSLFDKEIYAQQILPRPNTFKMKSLKKLSSEYDRANHFDVAYDGEDDKFVAVWSESKFRSGGFRSSLFTHRFARNGNPMGGTSFLFISTNGDLLAPELVRTTNSSRPGAFQLLYSRREIDQADNNLNGLYIASLTSTGGFPPAANPTIGVQILQDDLKEPGNLEIIPLQLFERPNGQIIAGLLRTYADNNGVRFDVVRSVLIRKNDQIKLSENYFSFQDDASFTEQYAFGMASTSNFATVLIDPVDGGGGRFFRFRANQSKIGGQYRIAGDDFSTAVAMVNDSNRNLYGLFQQDGSIVMIPFNKVAKAQPGKKTVFSFGDVSANGSYITAEYNSNFNTVMVVFQDHSKPGAPLYIAHLPIP